ncbi:MAG: molybdopterin molybdotransferase MoeA [Bacteroidia bacterium]|nr:molybdopterin molybdotransferase MoeA [Bacteroidia bacterium]
MNKYIKIINYICSEEMISVEEAKDLIVKYGTKLPIKEKSLNEAQNAVLAEDVLAPINLPPFRQSAMDGYAVNLSPKSDHYTIIGEVAAGESNSQELKIGEGVRIFTGAAVPDSANAVIMQEWVTKKANHIVLNSNAKELKNNMNIRPLGEQVQKGTLALSKGIQLNSSALGFIQSFGMEQIKVYKSPSISLIITGNEIVLPGNSLPFGSIYESNSLTLKTALNNAGYNDITINYAQDNLDEMKQKIERAMNTSDVVLVSGGISVGDYDFTKTAFEILEVKEHFHKIAQKPGKPLFFGSKESTSFFGLPGNPASALVCLYEYVIPHMLYRTGAQNPMPTTIQLPLKHDYLKRGERSQFLKAKINANNVEILDGQASSMLHTFALANCLVYIPSNLTSISKGEFVEVHLIR